MKNNKEIKVMAQYYLEEISKEVEEVNLSAWMINFALNEVTKRIEVSGDNNEQIYIKGLIESARKRALHLEKCVYELTTRNLIYDLKEINNDKIQ